MKVDKIYLESALEYIALINRQELNDLDLSEFEIDISDDDKETWRFTGLNNLDFIKQLL